MKIDVNIIKTTPKNLPFSFCVYGNPTGQVQDWIDYWGIKTVPSGKFTNFILPQNIKLSDLFTEPTHYKYVDSFSPNLNKKLHFGHLTNLIIAKFIQGMEVGDKYISVLGDTLSGSVTKEEAFNDFQKYCKLFEYKVDEILYASEQKITTKILSDGEGEYEGTKIFNIGGQKIVAIKNNGQTTYFYQDVAVAQKLNSPTLYITGFEQNEHFQSLKLLFPHINHIGMGLVLLDGKKMSSSEGNVIMVEDYLNDMKKIFDDDKLIYNIVAGSILSSTINSVKNIKTEDILNVKKSFGLYISYTQAKMWSAGLPYEQIEKFSDIELEYKYIKSKFELQPNILLSGLVQLCEKINQLYIIHRIKENIENQKMFQMLVNDLMLGCKYLGLFKIEKV